MMMIVLVNRHVLAVMMVYVTQARTVYPVLRTVRAHRKANHQIDIAAGMGYRNLQKGMVPSAMVCSDSQINSFGLLEPYVESAWNPIYGLPVFNANK